MVDFGTIDGKTDIMASPVEGGGKKDSADTVVGFQPPAYPNQCKGVCSRCGHTGFVGQGEINQGYREKARVHVQGTGP